MSEVIFIRFSLSWHPQPTYVKVGICRIIKNISCNYCSCSQYINYAATTHYMKEFLSFDFKCIFSFVECEGRNILCFHILGVDLAFNPWLLTRCLRCWCNYNLPLLYMGQQTSMFFFAKKKGIYSILFSHWKKRT